MSKERSSEEKLCFVKELCRPLHLSSDTLKQIKSAFLKEMEIGLGKKTDQKTTPSVKWQPTYIQKLPTECEKGKCFVLEIAGSGFYILLLAFNGTKNLKQISEKYVFPKHLLGGDVTSLCNFMVECLCRFVKKLSLHLENLPLAICLALYARPKDASLWKKDFNIPTEISENVVEILRKAVESRADIKISNYVLVNDTAAVLMSSAWTNNYSKIAFVVDKSCSACYLELIKHVASLEKSKTITRIPTMIMNTNWNCFGDNGCLDFISTPWDVQVNGLSATNPECKFEKMICGGYMGPLVRSILLDCIKTGALLQGNITTGLNADKSFKTSYIIEIESECYNSYQKTKDVLKRLGYANPEKIDCDIVRIVCEAVTRRSICLVAAVLAALIDHIGDPYVVVGVEGNICRCRANYCKDLQLKLRELVKPDHKFDIIIPEVERGWGAALVVFERAKLEKIFKSMKSSPVNETVLSVKTKSNILSKNRKLKRNSGGKRKLTTTSCNVRKGKKQK